MKTLRAKIALLLVTSIVAVVALITITMIYAFSAPEEDVVNRLAKQLILMERLAARDPGGAGSWRRSRRQVGWTKSGLERFARPPPDLERHWTLP